MKTPRAFAPLMLGLILLVAACGKKNEAPAKTEAKVPPVAAAPAPVVAPAAKIVVAAVPVVPAPPVVDPNAGYPALAAACRNEIGLFCSHKRKTIKAAKACLEDYRDNLLPQCKAALNE